MTTNANRQSNVLGETIRNVRKSKGMTQEQLGRKIGLGKSGISKIENGQTRITVEDASILLEAMGEKLEISVLGSKDSEAARNQKAIFLTTGIAWFADAHNIPVEEAYRYLMRFKGIDFLEENYRFEQTLPQSVVVKDLTRICSNNGGTL